MVAVQAMRGGGDAAPAEGGAGVAASPGGDEDVRDAGEEVAAGVPAGGGAEASSWTRSKRMPVLRAAAWRSTRRSSPSA